MAEYVTDYVEDKALEIHDGDMAISADVNGLQEVYCNIDREQMVRVLDNLVENARKYAGKCAGRSAAQYTDKSAENNAGETMLNGDSLQMRLSLQKQDGKLVLDFSDNGVGVPEDKLDKIFEQFYREDESRSSEGNGLGLYVCKYIVEQHGGTIRAYNQNGLHIEILLPEVEGGGSDGKNIVGGR